jgi:hypothetical protein
MNETTHGRSCRARPRRAGILAVTAGLVLLTAACGGSPSSTGTGSSSNAGGSASPQAASLSALGFARCMRSHGVPNFPDPDSSGQFDKRALAQLGLSAARMRAVASHCPFSSGPPPITAQDQQDYRRAAACMRSHGIINFPDPVFSGGSVSLPTPLPVDTGSPQFNQARQICQRLIPAGLPYSGTGSGG